MCSVLASRVLLQVVLQALRKFLRPGKLIMVVDVSHGGDGIGNEPIVVHIEHGARVGVSGRQVARYLMLVEAQNRFGHLADVSTGLRCVWIRREPGTVCNRVSTAPVWVEDLRARRRVGSAACNTWRSRQYS